MRREKKYIALALVMCLLCSMTGCGKKSAADSLKELSNEGGVELEEKGERGDEVSAVSSALAERLGISEDKLKYEVRMDGSNTSYNVDAEIFLPETDKVGVYEEQLLNLTEDKVISYAKNLFDGGKYEQKKPYAACTKEELDIIKSDIEKEMSEANDTYVEDEYRRREKIDELDFYLEHYIKPVQEYEEGKYYNCQYYEAARKNEDLAGYLLYYSRIMILEGNIGGTPYELVAYQADPQYGDSVNSYLKLYREDEVWSQCSWQSSAYHYSMASSSGEENICEFTEEEAENLATNCMGMMGFENMGIVQTEWLFWQRTPIENKDDEMYEPQIIADGYSFYMARTYNGISGMHMPIGLEWLSADGSSYAEQEVYVVNVDSKGVISVECGPIYENTNAISEDAELLAFSDVNEKAKAAFEEEIGKLIVSKEENEGDADGGNEGDSQEEGNADGGNEGDLQEEGEGGCVQVERGAIYIKWVKLACVNVQYEGKFRLTPVWVFASYTNDMEYPEVVINALDGTRIKRNDNEYQCIH